MAADSQDSTRKPKPPSRKPKSPSIAALFSGLTPWDPVLEAIARTGYSNDLEWLEKKFRDPLNYTGRGWPSEKERDAGDIEFLKLKIEHSDLRNRLATGPPPKEAAKIRRTLLSWPKRFSKYWTILKTMDDAIEHVRSENPHSSAGQRQKRKPGPHRDDDIGIAIHRLREQGVNWPMIKKTLDARTEVHRSKGAYQMLYRRWKDRQKKPTK